MKLTTKAIQDAVSAGGLTPQLVAEYRAVLSGIYAQDSESLARVLAERSKKWKEIRSQESCVSDKQADREYEGTESGIAEMRLKLKLKATEKLMSALRMQLEVMSNEAKNLW